MVEVTVKLNNGEHVYSDVEDIEHGVNDIGQFILVTYYKGESEYVGLHYTDTVKTIFNTNTDEVYYRRF